MRRFHLIIFLLLCITSSIAVVMHNRAVLQWTWGKVQTLTRGVVTAQRVEGVLAGPITVEGLLIRLPGSDLAITSASLDWHPGQLLLGRLSIIDAHLSELIITVHPGESTTPPPADVGVNAPLTLLAGAASVQHLVIRREGITDLTFDNIVVEDAEWRGARLWAERIAVESPWGTLAARGYVATRAATPIDLQTRFTPARALIDAPVELAGHLGGTLGHLQLAQQLSGVTHGAINGEIAWSPGPLHWQATADLDPFSLQKLRGAWRPVVVGGHLEGSGDFRRNVLRGDVSLGDKTLGRWHGVVSLTQDRDLIEIGNLQLRGRGHAAQIEGQGKLRLAAAPRYVTDADLQLRWRDLIWPVASANEKVRSSDGTAHVSGALHDYHLATDLAVAAAHSPPSRWQVQGQGDLHHFNSPALQVQGLGGRASGEASVTWSPHLAWHARLNGKGLDPGSYWPQWPARLDIDISSDGDWRSPHALNIDVQSLHGSMRGYSVAGKGRVDYQDGQWRIAALHVASGSAVFSASGALLAPWGVTWKLDAPQLGQLLPQARGSVHASGTIDGNGMQPRITLDAAATDTAWNEARLHALTLQADIDLAAQLPWLLRLHADDLRWGDKPLLNFIDLQGQGSAGDHQLELQVDRPDGRFSQKIAGGYHDGEWRGVLHDGLRSGREGESLKQEAPAEFSITRTAQQLSPYCWKGDEARGCIDYTPDPAGGSVLNASLAALPVSLFAQWLPREDVQIGGKIFAGGRLRIAGGLREASLDARVEGGTLHYRHPLGRIIDLQFKQFSLLALSKEGNSHAMVELALTNGDTMHLVGQMPGWSVGMPLQASQRVAGSADLSMRDLSWLTLVVPEILDPQGVISAQLALGGTAGEPQLTGNFALTEGTVSIPRAGLTLRKLALAASSPDGVSMHLAGAATSGPGYVTIEGNIRGESLEKWHSEFLLRGDRFEAVRLPTVHLLASPEIRAVIDPHRLDVDGTLRVPEADIKLPELPTTVRQSSDVVLVSGKEPVAEETPWKISSRLTLQLGDYVRLEGYGFKGRIDGQLTITEEPDALATGQGELQVHEGRYKAYGQDLTIDTGRLLFANSPIDNPALDVRASRSKDNVTVGVNITGRLQRPELRLFSEPAMEESDALAYLVLGHSLRNASSSEATSVTAAATSLSLVGGERVAQVIGSQFGIQEVSVSSEYQSKDAALLLGKYLSPRLYLQYAVVFSSAINITRLRYELTNHWYLKLESGEQQAADILYTFER